MRGRLESELDDFAKASCVKAATIAVSANTTFTVFNVSSHTWIMSHLFDVGDRGLIFLKRQDYQSIQDEWLCR